MTEHLALECCGLWFSPVVKVVGGRGRYFGKVNKLNGWGMGWFQCDVVTEYLQGWVGRVGGVDLGVNGFFGIGDVVVAGG